MMLTNLADIARRTGYPVVEVAGWKTRSTSKAGMVAVKTITCHHTANGGAAGNYPSLRVVRDGRTGLPGPLAQLGLGVDGTIYVIAAGKCNHAGESRATAYTNSYAIGIEAEAEGVPGDRQDWPAAQWDAYVRLCRVLIDAYQLDASDVRGHKETCSPAGRKSDPSFDMGRLRSQVRTLDPVRKPGTTDSKGGTSVPFDIDSNQLTDHPYTKSDIEAIGKPELKVGQTTAWSSILRFPPAVARLRREVAAGINAIRTDISGTRSEVSALKTQVTELRALVEDRLPQKPEA